MNVEKKQDGSTRKEMAVGEMPQDKAMAMGMLGGVIKQDRAAREGIAGEAEPAASLKCQKLAGGDKAEAGKGKRIAKVSQKYIDILLKEKATGTGMYSESKIRPMEYIQDYEGSVDLGPIVARINAIREEVRAGDARILDQYHSQGYAYDEVEEESFVNDVTICGPLARSRPLPLHA